MGEKMPAHLQMTLLVAGPSCVPLQLVFLDVEIKQKPVGRIEMVLFSDVSPRAAENFR
jgi:hypothetical protein